jgi:hypothetical protein
MLNTLVGADCCGSRKRNLVAFHVDPTVAVADQLNAWLLLNKDADVNHIEVLHVEQQVIVLLYYY